MKVILFILWFVAVAVVATLTNGYVVFKYYEWFIVNTFHTPPITLVQSIGLSLFFSTITHGLAKEKEDKDEDSSINQFVKPFLKAIGILIFALLFGFIVKSFM